MAIVISAGDTHKLVYTTKRRDGTVVDISGATITYKVGKSDSADALITKTVGSGITITNGPDGLFEVLISSSDTSLLKGEYRYQTKMVLPSGQQTVDRGVYSIKGIMA